MEEWREVAGRISNWGRWGAHDQLGTLNLIQDEQLRRASTCVRRGTRFSLGIDLDGRGPQGGTGHRRNPIHLMSLTGGDAQLGVTLDGWGTPDMNAIAGMFAGGPLRVNDDYLILPTQAASQWDALAHAYYDGKLYNDVPASKVTGFGATRDGIDNPARDAHVVGRGVLIDVARHRGVDYLPPRATIQPDELDDVLRAQGTTLEVGDIAVIRTGWWRQFTEEGDPDTWTSESPGLSWRTAAWLHEHDVAAVAADNPAVEVMMPETDAFLPLHMLALRDMGLLLGEIWDLEALSADCAEDGVHEFFLAAPALRITGGTGTPINPVAIK